MTNKPINLQEQSNRCDSSKLNIDDEIQFYAIVIQLIIGLMANFIVLCSMAISIRRRHRFDYHHQQVRRKRIPVPVVDIIILLLVMQSILRILLRPAIQLGCFYGYCFIFNNLLCYLQGFIITFIHYIHLWTMMMFLQDRYIKHYKPANDYLCKCTHTVLYLTMSCAMFLVAIHLCAPFYGLSSYGFLHGELTCAVDWTARHSCPFYIYSVLLVSGPASLPTIYWTMKITYRSLSRKCWTFNLTSKHLRQVCCCLKGATNQTTTTTTTATVSCPSPTQLQQHQNKNNNHNHNHNHNSNIGNYKIPSIIHHREKIQIKQNININQNQRFSSLIPLSQQQQQQQQPEYSKNNRSHSIAIQMSTSTSSVVSCDNSTILSTSGESHLDSAPRSKNGQGSNPTIATATTPGTKGHSLTVVPMKKLKIHKRSSGSERKRNCSVKETAICYRNNNNNGNNSRRRNKQIGGRADSLPRSHTMFMSSGGGGNAATSPASASTNATSSSIPFQSSSSQLCRSLVLNEQRELITVAICAWIFLCGYLLKLSSDAWQSCFLMSMPDVSNPAYQHPSPSDQRISMVAMSTTIAAAAILMNTNVTTNQTTTSATNQSQSQLYFRWFLASYLDEMATTVLIPLILLTLHQRLRVILGICLEFVCLFKLRLKNWACFKVRTTHHYHNRHHIAACGTNSRNCNKTTTTTTTRRSRSRSNGNCCRKCCCPPYGSGDDDGGGSGL